MPTCRIGIFRWPARPEPHAVYRHGAAGDAEWFATQGAVHLDAEHDTVRPADSRPPLPRGRWEQPRPPS